MIHTLISCIRAICKWLWNVVFMYIVRFISFVLSRILIVVGIIVGIITVISTIKPTKEHNITVVYEADIDPTRPNPRQGTGDTTAQKLMQTDKTSQPLSGLSLSGITVISGTNIPGTMTGMSIARPYDPTLSGSILIIDIHGIILGHKPPTMTFLDLVMYQGITFASDIIEQITYAQTNDDITAVLIRINSPGGTVIGANMIAQALMELQKTKPVYSFVTEMATSGGFWVVAATNKIIAERGSQIGSIGVIMGPFIRYDEIIAMNNIQAVAPANAKEKIGGITISYLTAGEGKDFGNPFRKMTDKERRIAQSGINDMYSLFVAHVASGRNVSGSIVRNDRGAYIYDTMTAVRKGLIDHEGDLWTAIDMIGEQTGIHPKHFTILQRNKSSTNLLGQVGPRVLAHLTSFSSPKTELCHSHQSLVLPYTTMTILCH